jgi:hypothetical protein
MASDTLKSLIVFIRENENVQNIRISISKYLDLLKENSDYYELILVTDRSSKFFEDIRHDLLNEFKNVCFIHPTTKIDVDIALTLGLINSIGDKAICFTEDIDYSLVRRLVVSEEKSNVFIRSKSNDSINVFLVHRATINALIHIFGSVRIKLLERSLTKIGHPFIISLEQFDGRINIMTRYLKKLRIIYNEYFVQLVAFLLIPIILLRPAYIMSINYYHIFFDMVNVILISFLVLIFSKKITDMESNNSMVNYRIYRSDFVDIKKLNVLK